MACKVKACAKCTRNCVSAHGIKKHPSPVITSFFKVLIGDQFSKVLFLPPKFACTVTPLVDQKIDLEDSSGRRWVVTLSNIGGSFAFQQGWHTFSLDHGLEVGDFLVFSYIMGSHFFVQIFKKTGCETLDFPVENRNHKKRNRTSRDSDGSCHTTDKGSIDKHGSSTSVVSGSDIEEINQSQCIEDAPMAAENTSNCENGNVRHQMPPSAGYIEEPYYIIDRDVGYKGANGSLLVDLFSLEVQKSITGAGINDEALAEDRRADLLLKSETEVDIVNENPVAEELVTRVVPLDASDSEMVQKKEKTDVRDNMLQSQKGSYNDTTPGQPLTTSVMNTEVNGNDNPDVLNKVIKECQTSEKSTDAEPGERMKVIKQEHVEMNIAMSGALKVVKAEAVNSNCSPTSDAASISCLVKTDDPSHLELMTCLPSPSKMKMGRSVVLLRDPGMRLWPVLYHKRPGLTVLNSGWEGFSRANRIQAGDKCVFDIESEDPEFIYRVSIVRKQKKLY
ncbi:uncharacterized protein LOC131159478 isoform X4 [Malania oleifera]|uniref:uncharacterized protein LOC131159478 isoform X4 n=1 Tax=Malania oleifera TaxID=397392 RepID=UPI0025AD9E01|nr:uncharacterized protein LOC131159478 isoform X4 [Malania oleifera]XP_057970408.1 uncharacterized protein LOC131159478 isoform X4 [Malania oleifera]